MLYSILPPIIVVLSLAAIIVFLMKKAGKTALLIRQEPAAVPKSKEENSRDFRQKLLVILERATRRFKVIFLKLENLFTGWGESIRRRRRKSEGETTYRPKENEREIFERRKSYMKILRENIPGEAKEPEIKRVFIRQEENTVRPMISEKVAQPRNSEAKKDLFEKIMIERIAANPRDVEAYQRLGEYYIEIESWEYAKECFKQVIKLDPKNSNVKMKMRKLERLLGK